MPIHAMLKQLVNFTATVLSITLPHSVQQALLDRIADRRIHWILQAWGPRFNRKPNLENMPFDLPIEGDLRFEHLAGLFASTSLDHAVIMMPIRQTAYLFGLVQQMQIKKAIEIGRYKGASTLVISAAMRGKGKLWSIDLGDKETRLHSRDSKRTFDQQLSDRLTQFGMRNVELLVGDSRTIEVETGSVDLVFIDGDHSYEGVKSDFERFGRRVRKGGAVLFDDATEEGVFHTHSDTVGRVVQEIIASGDFRLVQTVNRLAHLERIR